MTSNIAVDAQVLPRHLAQLEAEAIHILRETAAAFERPVLHYSIGKDSGVLLHLAIKAFRRRKFKAAIGGARRDKEKSRAKERVFSHAKPSVQGC